jgi:hypothetical protein
MYWGRVYIAVAAVKLAADSADGSVVGTVAMAF